MQLPWGIRRMQSAIAVGHTTAHSWADRLYAMAVSPTRALFGFTLAVIRIAVLLFYTHIISPFLFPLLEVNVKGKTWPSPPMPLPWKLEIKPSVINYRHNCRTKMGAIQLQFPL